MSEKLDILAFSTHPDDAELGCGGTLLRAVAAGLQVGVADVTEGEMSSRGNPTTRRAEKEEAARRLGIAARYDVGLPDTQIASLREQELPIIALLRQTRPHTVLLPYPQDRHPDHVAAAAVIRRAAFYAGVKQIETGDEVYRPVQLIHYMHHYPFQPSFIVDVSDVWQQRMHALAAYGSQFSWIGANGHGPDVRQTTALSRAGFGRMLEARAIFYGAMIGVAYGEPFHQEGPVGLDMLPLPQSAAARDALPHYRMFA